MPRPLQRPPIAATPQLPTMVMQLRRPPLRFKPRRRRPHRRRARRLHRRVRGTASSDVDVNERIKSGKFNFEFSKADIMDVVKAISNLTQRNFIIPEKIKSQKITILSPGQISASEAYTVFLAALESNGITIVRSGKFYKLVESKEAIKSPIPTCIGQDDDCPQNVDQMITEMVRLNYVDGQQLNNVAQIACRQRRRHTAVPTEQRGDHQRLRAQPAAHQAHHRFARRSWISGRAADRRGRVRDRVRDLGQDYPGLRGAGARCCRRRRCTSAGRHAAASTRG